MRLPNGQTTRACDLGIRIGVLPTGPTASIADVPGLGVGHVTVWRDERSGASLKPPLFLTSTMQVGRVYEPRASC